jgi:hypothetical protein
MSIAFGWYPVTAIQSGVILQGRIGYSTEDSGECFVQLELDGHPSIEARAPWDLFTALGEVRAALEPDRIVLKVNGARLNVYPSGMQRDMGQGLPAYVMHLPRTTTHLESVNIFDPAPDGEPLASISAQKAWRDEWIRSPLEQ